MNKLVGAILDKLPIPPPVTEPVASCVQPPATLIVGGPLIAVVEYHISPVPVPEKEARTSLIKTL